MIGEWFMVVLYQCVSATYVYPTVNTTMVYSCPNSVRYEYRVMPRTPWEVARLKHYMTMDRDDRMPVVKKKKTRVAKRYKKS